MVRRKGDGDDCDHSDERTGPLTVNPRNLLTLLLIAGILLSSIAAGYSTYTKANQAQVDILRLDKEKVSKDSFDDLKQDVKEIKKDLRDYILSQNERERRGR